MNGKSDLTDAASQDWSKFDFTRWNLEGLHLDPQPAAVSAWLRDLLLSPQGPQEFAAADCPHGCNTEGDRGHRE